MEGSLPLDTYLLEGEGDVPYVNLNQFLKAYMMIRDLPEDTLALEKAGDEYVVTPKGGQAAFKFAPKGNFATIEKGSRNIFGFYGEGGTIPATFAYYGSIDAEKQKVTSLYANQKVDFSKYGLLLFEDNGTLYAPMGLFETMFAMRDNTGTSKSLTYNGEDYYNISGSGNYTSCYSSKLCFGFVDDNAANIPLAYPNLGINPYTTFSQKDAQSGEKYRFESNTIITNEVTPVGEETPRKAVPDYYQRIILKNDGTGLFQYINASTGEPFWDEKGGFVNNRQLTFTEDENQVDLTMAITLDIGGSVQSLTSLLHINKKETFYLQEKRSQTYANYDFNITRLFFGEFYGLKETHPEILDIDRAIEPYKDLICSTSFKDYNLGMSKFLLGTVDDGHTRVVDYSPFYTDTFDKSTEFSYSLMGRRKKGLFDMRDAYMAMRDYAGAKQGYEIVGDTAYLAFDSFTTKLAKVSTYTQEPNSYVESDTVGFVRSAFNDLEANHPEVKRVVYDLTCNGGGMVLVVPYLLATMSSDPTIWVNDYYSGDAYEEHVKIDLNGDGVPGGEGDTYEGKYQFYVLTSHFSFSCGNAFPGLARAAKSAKIIGERSGGGGSMVDNCTSISGYSYTTSSRSTMLTTDENGNLVENDDGIIVDLALGPATWYRREKINEALQKAYPLTEGN